MNSELKDYLTGKTETLPEITFAELRKQTDSNKHLKRIYDQSLEEVVFNDNNYTELMNSLVNFISPYMEAGTSTEEMRTALNGTELAKKLSLHLESKYSYTIDNLLSDVTDFIFSNFLGEMEEENLEFVADTKSRIDAIRGLMQFEDGIFMIKSMALNYESCIMNSGLWEKNSEEYTIAQENTKKAFQAELDSSGRALDFIDGMAESSNSLAEAISGVKQRMETLIGYLTQ